MRIDIERITPIYTKHQPKDAHKAREHYRIEYLKTQNMKQIIKVRSNVLYKQDLISKYFLNIGDVKCGITITIKSNWERKTRVWKDKQKNVKK